MYRLVIWLLAAALLVSVSPAAAQPGSETEAPPEEESVEVAPEMDPAPVQETEPAPPVDDGTAVPIEPPTPPVEQPAARTNFPYGVLVAELSNAHIAREAGFRVMAVVVSWRRTQPIRGQYPFEQTDQWGQPVANDITNILNAARNNGMKLAIRITDPPDWAGGTPARVDPAALEDYAYHVAHYARDSLAYVELFNEPNLAFEWGAPPNPEAFASLMAAAHRGVKRANQSIPVINGGPSQRTGGQGGSIEDVEWLDRFLAAGGRNSVDALGVHAYMGNFDAAADPSCLPLCFGQVHEFRAVMQRHGAPQSMYITEFGALEDTPTDLGQFNWQKLSPDQRARNLVGALRTASVEYPWIAGATMFNLDHATVGYIPPNSEERWFSLLNPDKSPRQAFFAIRDARQSGALP